MAKEKNRSTFARNTEVKERKKNNFLSLENRLRVIELLKSGKKSEETVAKIVGNISRSQVHRISKNREKLIQIASEGVIRSTAKRIKNEAHHPEIDQGVLKWVNLMRNPPKGRPPLPLSRSLIQERARHEAGLRGIQNFKASNGWFANWKKRCSLEDSIRLFGEAADVDQEQLKPLMQDLRAKLEMDRYSAKCIFNMDETGLFYRVTPSRTYVSPLEGPRANVRGSKSLKAKDRITLVFCVNATGIIFFFSIICQF